MQHYTFDQTFKELYDHALALYQNGQRGADTFFSPEQIAWLTAQGINAQHLYDYAEDASNHGEPTFGTALLVESIRRDYFLRVQQGRPSSVVLDEASMPSKSDAVQGIAWLPRLLPKARAKLRGELPPTLMYGCGGDRRFFKERDLHPAEFLAAIARQPDDDQAIINWVAGRA